MDDVFNFESFLNKSGSKKIEPVASIKDIFKDAYKEEPEVISEETIVKETVKSIPVKENVLIKETIDIIEDPEVEEELVEFEEEELVEEEPQYEKAFVQDTDDSDFYKLYQDKNEEFVCDIMIEGSSPEETYARVIIESENWSLVFPGEIRNGKCIVPIKKLNILKEGEIGNIKLEVVAEGNLFIPWENQFKVKMSKKVTVMMNENKKQTKKPIIQNKIGVRVNVK